MKYYSLSWKEFAEHTFEELVELVVGSSSGDFAMSGTSLSNPPDCWIKHSY